MYVLILLYKPMYMCCSRYTYGRICKLLYIYAGIAYYALYIITVTCYHSVTYIMVYPLFKSTSRI